MQLKKYQICSCSSLRLISFHAKSWNVCGVTLLYNDYRIIKEEKQSNKLQVNLQNLVDMALLVESTFMKLVPGLTTKASPKRDTVINNVLLLLNNITMLPRTELNPRKMKTSMCLQWNGAFKSSGLCSLGWSLEEVKESYQKEQSQHSGHYSRAVVTTRTAEFWIILDSRFSYLRESGTH